MIQKLLLASLLMVILLNIPSLVWYDYAFSKGEDDESDKVKDSKESEEDEEDEEEHEDSDKDKIYDDLEDDLEVEDDNYRTGIIATLNVSAEQVKDKVKELKKKLGDFEVDDTYSAVPGFAGKLSKKQILALAGHDTTVQIEPDVEVHAFLNTATSSFGVKKVRTDFSVDGDRSSGPPAYNKNDIVIAIIDTGIDRKHLDLDGGKIIGWKDYVLGRTTAYDDNGHGTHVASIATGEGQGKTAYAGVAPKAALVGVKVLNSAGSAPLSRVVSGVNWVIANKVTFGIEIFSMSLGTSGSSDGNDLLSLTVDKAVTMHGLVGVVAAGNSGPRDHTIGSPGASREAITVGAMADVGNVVVSGEPKVNGFYLASFSSRGPTADGRLKPDVAGPGVSVMAAKRATTSSYVAFSGTSMATPFVAGLAALMLDADPTLSPSQVKSIIISTAIDWGIAGPDIDYGSGRVDGYNAVDAASSLSGVGNTVPVHSSMADALEGTGFVDTYPINVINTAYPIGITMIMPGWTGSTSPDFDIKLYNPSGSLIASSEGVSRQETIGVSVSSSGSYRLEVFSYTGSGPYNLDISAGT